MKNKALLMTVLITFMLSTFSSFVPTGLVLGDSPIESYPDGLIAYEGFDYEAGTEIKSSGAVNGGYGWDTKWIVQGDGVSLYNYKVGDGEPLKYNTEELEIAEPSNYIISTPKGHDLGGRLFKEPHNFDIEKYLKKGDKLYFSFLANFSSLTPSNQKTGFSLVSSRDGLDQYGQAEIARIFFNDGKVGIGTPVLNEDGTIITGDVNVKAESTNFKFKANATDFYIVELIIDDVTLEFAETDSHKNGDPNVEYKFDYTLNVYDNILDESYEPNSGDAIVSYEFKGDIGLYEVYGISTEHEVYRRHYPGGINAINITPANEGMAKYGQIRVGSDFASVIPPTVTYEGPSYEEIWRENVINELGYYMSEENYENLIAYEGFNKLKTSNEILKRSVDSLRLDNTIFRGKVGESQANKGFKGPWERTDSGRTDFLLALDDKLNQDAEAGQYIVTSTDNYIYGDQPYGGVFRRELDLAAWENKGYGSLYISFLAKVNEITNADRIGGVVLFRSSDFEQNNIGLHFDPRDGKIYLQKNNEGGGMHNGGLGTNHINSGNVANKETEFNKANLYVIEISEVEEGGDCKIKVYMNPHAEGLPDGDLKDNYKIKELEHTAQEGFNIKEITHISLFGGGTDLALDDIRIGLTPGSVIPVEEYDNGQENGLGELLVHEDFNYEVGESLKDKGRFDRGDTNGEYLPDLQTIFVEEDTLSPESYEPFYKQLERGWYGFLGRYKNANVTPQSETFKWCLNKDESSFKVFNETLSYDGLLPSSGKSVGAVAGGNDQKAERQFDETLFRNKDEVWLSALVKPKTGFKAGGSVFSSIALRAGTDADSSEKTIGMGMWSDNNAPYWALFNHGQSEGPNMWKDNPSGVEGVNYTKGVKAKVNVEETSLLVMHLRKTTKEENVAGVVYGLDGTTPLLLNGNDGMVVSLYVNPNIDGSTLNKENLASIMVVTREEMRNKFPSLEESFKMNTRDSNNFKSIHLQSASADEGNPSVLIGDIRLGTAFRSAVPLAPQGLDIEVKLHVAGQVYDSLDGLAGVEGLNLTVSANSTIEENIEFVAGLYDSNGKLVNMMLANDKLVYDIEKGISNLVFDIGKLAEDVKSIKVMFWKNMVPIEASGPKVGTDGVERWLTIQKVSSEGGYEADSYSNRMIEYK